LLVVSGWLGLAFLMPGLARAHFLWLTAEGEKPTVHAFLSETPTPEAPEFLKHIEHARITSGGKALSWTKAEDTFRVNLPEPGPDMVDGFCDLGVKTRGGASFNLIYTARVQFGPSAAGAADEADHLRMRLVARSGQAPVILVRFRGQPASGVAVKAFPADGDPIELKSDLKGHVEHPLVGKDGTAFLGKWFEKSPGERDGKPYDEIRFYATLTIAPAHVKNASAATTSPPKTAFAVLPEAVNSFGGAVLEDWLYVYSGHTGQTHHYDKGTTTKHFRRLNLKDRTTWEELPCGPALQGVVLVAHEDSLYRIGGMAAHNRPGQPNPVASIKGTVYVLGGLTDHGKVVKLVDLYDPPTHAWSRGPDLPGGKLLGFGPSAFGVGDRLYVCGGDGVVQRLNETGDGWEVAGKLTLPRLTHRLLPGIADDLLAVGGTKAQSPVSLIESVPLAGSGRGAR
jgi:Kelch motif